MENAALLLLILLMGASAGGVTYLTHEYEGWSKWAIGVNAAVILMVTCKDLWSWVRYESGNFKAFLDMLATGVTPSMMLGMVAFKAITYVTGLTAGVLYMHREYRLY